ncbi:MAG: rhomboid family intramembrane serine protease [Verrucomicrobiota bacterium]
MEEEDSDGLSEGAFAVIGSYESAKEAHEAGLAVLAAGHAYWVNYFEGRYLLLVARRQGEAMRREVALSDSFNRFWPPRALWLPDRRASKWPTAGACVGLVGMFAAQSRWPALEEIGLSGSVEIWEKGEWWRSLTAASLHADAGHLAGNLMGIALFAYLACRYFGNGLGWCLILFAASLANLSNAYTHIGEPFRSLGASTAVFAALGLLSGFPIGTFLRTKEAIQTKDWLVPFFGGCVLFAWMGGGEFPTDVPGHLWAFFYGTVLSTLAAWGALLDKMGKEWQAALLCGALSAMGIAWGLALG